MSGTAEVYAALKARLLAVSPGAAIPAASIAWENKAFTPTTGTRYYRATFLPGIPRSAGIGLAPMRHVGVFAVDIFEPAGRDHVAVTTEAERIVAAFQRGLALSYSGLVVHIDRSYVARIGAQPDPAWFQVPVRIEWRADVPLV